MCREVLTQNFVTKVKVKRVEVLKNLGFSDILKKNASNIFYRCFLTKQGPKPWGPEVSEIGNFWLTKKIINMPKINL